jgi:salicylate hydroxylase
LIGADGIRSTIRRQLVDACEPQVAGPTIYPAVIPMDRVSPEPHWKVLTFWAGRIGISRITPATAGNS